MSIKLLLCQYLPQTACNFNARTCQDSDNRHVAMHVSPSENFPHKRELAVWQSTRCKGGQRPQGYCWQPRHNWKTESATWLAGWLACSIGGRGRDGTPTKFCTVEERTELFKPQQGFEMSPVWATTPRTPLLLSACMLGVFWEKDP